MVGMLVLKCATNLTQTKPFNGAWLQTIVPCTRRPPEGYEKDFAQ